MVSVPAEDPQRPHSLDFAHFVRLVLDAIEAVHLKYLIGGAVAVWAWGDVRTTRDLDLVIELPIESIVDLSHELARRDMLVPADIILDILIFSRSDLAVDAIHMYSGYKAELFLLRPDDPHRALALERRLLVDLGPPIGEAWVHSPEDLILYKLRYFSISRQTKHLRDIGSIMLTLGQQLELDYITTWSERLGLAEIWREVRAEVGYATGD
ncbi:MAG: hypothetical protein FJ011_12765 [Chloroflexi bacterium]|nr:hypothetical protein [Chloroflexota bacterium]